MSEKSAEPLTAEEEQRLRDGGVPWWGCLDQIFATLDAERAAHRETIREMQGADANWMVAANARDAAEARVRVLEEALERYHERVLVDAMMEGPRVKGFNAHGKLAGRTLADDYDFACAALSALTSTAQEE